ncbi:HET-domain-containing protein [Hypoxylon rubiginosum]|uniref:HET-domain-containing protein n=1 Tax=Hypoxylon rubiginosum TaxID=110542 RepID=A0ACB9Z0W2_9PEZI|nr:HET-domain-containing protein [Hypoxylon rubiginosum]
MTSTGTYRDLITAISPALNLSNVTSAPPSQPCAVCARLVPDRSKAERLIIETRYELFDTFPEFPVLKASARAGCALCRLIRKTIRSSWAVAMRPMEERGLGVLSSKDGVWDTLFDKPWDRKVRIFDAYFYLSSRRQHQNDSHPLEFIQSLGIRFGPANLPPEEDNWTYKREIHQELMFDVFDLADTCKTGNSDDSFTIRRPPDGDTLSERNVALMKNWISTCKNQHTACQLDASANWLPTRLIQISKLDMFNVRLVETGHLNSHSECPVQFMALSHMWGDVSISPPLRTLKSNYDSMQQEIYMEELSQNFVDAVLVCRKLGVEYVWIDSLCIIQDSPEDWKREAVTMHLVYKYAQATIVAAAAKSSRDGFLARNTRMTPAVKVAYTSKVGQLADTSMILYPTSEESQLDFGYESSQWNTRGWTFQERYLSTRLIYFCKNMLHFECRACRHSEEGEAVIPTGPNNSLWPRTKLAPEKWFRVWTEMIIKYTTRKLTYGDDKLIAVQSIVNEMKENVLGPYIDFAGVWQANIHRELLWRPYGIPTYPDKQRAPSWSWASLDGGVEFPMTASYDRQYGEALEVVRFNEAALPEIVVKAHTRRIKYITKIHTSDLFDEAEHGGYLYNILTDEPASSDGDTQPWVFAHGILDRFNNDDILEKEAHFMYLHVRDSDLPTGLILKKRALGVQGNEPGADVWFRVGTAKVFQDLSERRIASKGFETQEKHEVVIV